MGVVLHFMSCSSLRWVDKMVSNASLRTLPAGMPCGISGKPLHKPTAGRICLPQIGQSMANGDKSKSRGLRLRHLQQAADDRGELERMGLRRRPRPRAGDRAARRSQSPGRASACTDSSWCTERVPSAPGSQRAMKSRTRGPRRLVRRVGLACACRHHAAADILRHLDPRFAIDRKAVNKSDHP